MALWILDIILVLGATLRLSRLVTTDDLGWWLVRSPAYRWAGYLNPDAEPRGWRQKTVSGLECPFCAGFWLGAGILASLAATGGPGDAATAWRYAAGALTLNYVIAHLSSRLDG